jgi:hypothetical protein
MNVGISLFTVWQLSASSSKQSIQAGNDHCRYSLNHVPSTANVSDEPRWMFLMEIASREMDQFNHAASMRAIRPKAKAILNERGAAYINYYVPCS